MRPDPAPGTLPARTLSISFRPMTHHVLFAATVLATALFFALLEIQIEGEEGWARGLPTWRYRGRWARLLLGGRTVTGYHLYAHLFVITLAHAAYALGPLPLSWTTEARLVAFIVLFWVFEDFLWFVMNPAYGLGRFRREHIPWHEDSWWWIMPREYWVFLPLGIGLYLVGS